MESMFDTLWKAADNEREKGNKERAAALYRRAFAVIGLDMDAFCGIPSVVVIEDTGKTRKNATKKSRTLPKFAPPCDGGICGR